MSHDFSQIFADAKARRASLDRVLALAHKKREVFNTANALVVEALLQQCRDAALVHNAGARVHIIPASLKLQIDYEKNVISLQADVERANGRPFDDDFSDSEEKSIREVFGALMKTYLERFPVPLTLRELEFPAWS